LIQPFHRADGVAEIAAGLMLHGAVVMDARMEKEYKHEQIAGARFAPYIEQSLKETEFDPDRDDYKAITSLSQDKPLILMGNRPKCWKSWIKRCP
jgi:rhodanese-related sulfurtransferase